MTATTPTPTSPGPAGADAAAWLREHWNELVLALATFLFALIEMIDPYFFGWSRFGLLIAIATAVAVGLYRRAPGAAIAIVWGTFAFQFIVGAPMLGTQALVLVVAYGAARWGRPATVWIGLASIPLASVLVVVVAMLRIIDLPPLLSGIAALVRDVAPGISLAGLFAATLIGIAVLGIPWILGYALRITARAQQRTEAAVVQAEAAREEEQRANETALLRAEQARLARDVHDVVGHSLTVILAQAESGQYLTTKASLQSTLATIADSARGSLQEIRRVLSATHGDDVIVPDLDVLIDTATASHPGIVSFESGEPRELPPVLRSTAYRVLQEMITNALKHGERDRALEIRREWDADAAHPGLTIEVRNGVAATRGDEPEGRGLTGMRERIAAVDGRLSVSRVGDTFAVTAWIPVR